MVRLGKGLGAAEISWDNAGTRSRSAKGLEVVLVRRLNKRESHYNVSEADRGIRNIQNGETRKTL